MAFTKLYLTTATAPYTPATIRGAWDDTAGAVTRALDVSKQTGGNITTVARAETNASANFDVLLYRGISGPIGAQTFGGTVDVVIGCLESNSAADFAWHLHIYVTQGDSDTPRGTLLADYVETTANEWPTTAAGKALASAQSLAAVAASAGDRIVVEIGYVALNAETTSRTGTLWYGTKVDAIAVGDLTAGGDETALAGFISFSASVSEGSIAVRDSQSFIEAAISVDAAIRDSQSLVEVIIDSATAGEIRNTQSFIEVILEVAAEPEPEPEPAPASIYPYGIIELGLGGSFPNLLREEHEATRLWRLGDVRTTLARDDMTPAFEAVGSPSPHGTYVGEPENGRGLLPEYGLSITLDGAAQYVNVDSGLEGTGGSFSLVALIQPGGSGSRCIIQTGTDAAYLGLDGSGHAVFGRLSGTLLTSSTAILAGERYFLVGTYDGTNARLYVGSIDDGGALEIVGPTAVTFTAAHDATQARIGATASGGNLFAGNLQCIATIASVLSAAEIEALFAATLWTDVSEDVHYPIVWDRGIHSDRPDTRWARTGTLSFSLDNAAETNSAGLLGYYSPEHANARAGFDRGIPCRVIQVLDQGSSAEERVIRFIGTIKTIQIDPGEYLQRNVPILVTDWMDEAAKASVAGLTTQTDVRADELMARLIDNMDQRPHAIELQEGSEIYTVAFHNLEDENSRVQTEGMRVVMSEQGLAYVRGDGTFVFEARSARQSASGIDYTLDQVIKTDPERSGLAILNRVKATAHPVRIDLDDTTILYSTFGEAGSPAAGSPLAIDHGVELSIFLPFKDPEQKAQRVGAIAIQTPVENVDIFINSAADGSGTDLINDPTISYSLTLAGNGVYLNIFNQWGQRVWLAIQILGQGVYDYEPVVVRSEDRDSIRREGLQELSIDLPYQSNPSIAQSLADYIRLSSLESPTRLRSVAYKMTGDADLVAMGAAVDISSRLAIAEVVSAVDRVFVVNGERTTWKLGDDVDVEYWLVTTLAIGSGGGSPGGGGGTASWVLGESLLGIDTRLGI